VLAFTLFKFQNLEDDGFSYIAKMAIYLTHLKW